MGNSAGVRLTFRFIEEVRRTQMNHKAGPETTPLHKEQRSEITYAAFCIVITAGWNVMNFIEIMS
jgi:hypothetical protein